MLWGININCVMTFCSQFSNHYHLASVAFDLDHSVLVFDTTNDISAVRAMPLEWGPHLLFVHMVHLASCATSNLSVPLLQPPE